MKIYKFLVPIKDVVIVRMKAETQEDAETLIRRLGDRNAWEPSEGSGPGFDWDDLILDGVESLNDDNEA